MGTLTLVVAVATTTCAASKISSPQQAAADARPPAPSVITATVEHRVLSQQVVFRGQVVAANPIKVTAPQLPSGDLPVVTAVDVRAGQHVSNGTVMVAVAGRPVIVMLGRIPAFRTMSPGDQGVDVAQLQAGLADLGYSIGGDTRGRFGYGTDMALRAFYAHLGFQPQLTSPDADSRLAAAAQAVTAASAQLNSDEAAVATTTVPAASPPGTGASAGSAPSSAEKVASDRQALATAEATLESLRTTTGAVADLGELIFVPEAEVNVVSVSAGLGSTVTSSAVLITLSAGGTRIQGSADGSQSSLIRPDEGAQVNDDVTGGHWPATVATVGQAAVGANNDQSGSAPTAPVTLNAAVPASEIGADVRVTVTGASTASAVDVVPVAAIFSTADGLSKVSVVGAAGERTVSVAVGLDVNGYVEVTARSGGLAAGDKVVVGAAPTKAPS